MTSCVPCSPRNVTRAFFSRPASFLVFSFLASPSYPSENTQKEGPAPPYLDFSARRAVAELRQLCQALPRRCDPLNGDYLLHPVLLQPQQNMRRTSVVHIILRNTSCHQPKISGVSFQP